MNAVDQLIDSLDGRITHLFIELFSNADEQLNIKTWRDRFSLVGTSASDPANIPENWVITFEDTHSPYALFNLHMNGQAPDDFSIDT